MHWILVSVLLIIGSVGVYLSIRKAQDLKIPLEMRNISSFAFPVIPLFVYNANFGHSMNVDFKYIALIFLTAIFFSWFASIASLKSLELAPNPGYSLIISKSYTIMTALLAVPLFGSDLSAQKVVSIIMIIIFSGLIIYDRKEERGSHSNLRWLWFALYSFFAWGFLALISTYLINEGLTSTVINFYLLTFVSVFIIAEIILRHIDWKKYLTRNYFRTIFAIGIFFLLFQQSMVYGYEVAPNPGFINAVNTGSIAFVTIASAIIFKDHLSPRKLLGVIGMIGGLALLFI